MAKKSLDERKILFVLVCKNKEEIQAQSQLLENAKMTIPKGWTIQFMSVMKSKNLAAAFNNLQKNTDAKYKIYLTAPAVWIDPAIVSNTMSAFFMEPKTAMVGLFGSEMPLDGDYTQAKNFYGTYCCRDGSDNVKNYQGKDALYFQSTHMLDDGYFATNEDLPWDEKIGEDFLIAAQCCNFRSRGYVVGVPHQENQWIIFANDERDYNVKPPEKNYSNQLEQFRNLYTKKIQPLVSVLIPSYNQPKFCQEALDSALAQTYKNIEILIGDDSTNTDVKNMVKPYLKKYPNIKFFYHDGKPYGGGKNMNTLLNDCSGEYVNFLLHDDLFYPEKIYKMMEYYVRDLEGNIGLVTSARDLVDENSKFIKRKNPWQPHADRIMNGIDVGRKVLFTLANFLGELSTVIFKKSDVAFKDNKGNKVYQIGCYCGITGTVYGDLDTWLQILKTGKDCVFMHECLSAFRQHAAQNTFNPYTRAHLPIDALGFCTISWLNNLFFRNVDEYKYCTNKWIMMSALWFTPITDADSDKVKHFKNWILELREICKTGDHPKILDGAIRFLLERLPEDNPLMPLIKKNERTGLWEKVNSPLEDYCESR